jgi:hypothetical protein
LNYNKMCILEIRGELFVFLKCIYCLKYHNQGLTNFDINY